MRFVPAFLSIALAAQLLVFLYSLELSFRAGGMPEGLVTLHLTAIAAFCMACAGLFRARVKRQGHVAEPETEMDAPETDYTSTINQRFETWRLTPAERDVAWFTMKGMSIGEIAALRGTSEGTVKAQGNAIYRKAGVGGRVQLLAAFMDELILSGDGPSDHGRSQGDDARVA